MTEEGGLQWAIQNGDFTCVQKHVKEGGSVNDTVKNRTPLHFAADYGQVEVLKFLLDNNANVNALDNYGITPLLAAIYENHVECVRLLLEKGASPDGQTPDEQSYDEIASGDVKKLLNEYRKKS